MLLAWRSIESDIRDLRLTLDNHQQRQATQGREQAAETLLRMVREAWRWLVVPVQMERRGGGLDEAGWEEFSLNPAAQGLGRELERVVVENELVIREWSPIHLHRLLAKWYWKDGVAEVPAPPSVPTAPHLRDVVADGGREPAVGRPPAGPLQRRDAVSGLRTLGEGRDAQRRLRIRASAG
ncbi:hypothetical protein [Thermomonas sp.]|uniref:hypothetical protein n=1 Tax=Thermomonas sp. TaxID=1971895 RepID=UPI00260C0336|nr:hypothetical protein [Thermomonas sp.]